MELKRTIGYIIEYLGIFFLVCATVVIILTASDSSGIKLLTVFGGLGLFFLVLGRILLFVYKPMERDERLTHLS